MFLDSFSLLALTLASANAFIFPTPTTTHISGPIQNVDVAKFKIVTSPTIDNSQHQRLAYAMEKYTNIIVSSARVVLAAQAAPIALSPPLTTLTLHIEGNDALENFPSIRTNQSYTLTVENGVAVGTATSQYGLIYALESFTQLIEDTGTLPGTTITIRDAPAYQWRGLMLDAGRRFIPVSTVKNLLDTMAAVKLNVLHLHASDMCRFGVESKKYPNLTASLTGIHAGFYTQKDIADLVNYAANAGIRVVPEFDVPGHSRGIRPLMSNGVQFCRGEDADDNQLYNDPAGKTYGIVRDLLQEMSTLFPDEVFNIGCDETGIVDDCTLNSTFSFERKLFSDIADVFNKTPAGWEEAAFDAGAATSDTIVDAWARHSAAEVIARGWRAIESKDSAFYMTSAVKGGPVGWKAMWYDISTNVPPSNISRLLGGEISMWTDTYCFSDQCGAFGPKHAVPVGAPLFPPSMDEKFGKSIGGMIWPRGYVGAASFWSYDAKVDPSSDAFVSKIWTLNDKLVARGSLVCPTNCTCDQLSACGTPY